MYSRTSQIAVPTRIYGLGFDAASQLLDTCTRRTISLYRHRSSLHIPTDQPLAETTTSFDGTRPMTTPPQSPSSPKKPRRIQPKIVGHTAPTPRAPAACRLAAGHHPPHPRPRGPSARRRPRHARLPARPHPHRLPRPGNSVARALREQAARDQAAAEHRPRCSAAPQELVDAPKPPPAQAGPQPPQRPRAPRRHRSPDHPGRGADEPRPGRRPPRDCRPAADRPGPPRGRPTAPPRPATASSSAAARRPLASASVPRARRDARRHRRRGRHRRLTSPTLPRPSRPEKTPHPER
jgi:hypothetical protein